MVTVEREYGRMNRALTPKGGSPALAAPGVPAAGFCSDLVAMGYGSRVAGYGRERERGCERAGVEGERVEEKSYRSPPTTADEVRE